MEARPALSRPQPLSASRLIEQHLAILKGLQYESGLFAAAKKDSTTGYNKSWLRDNFYECLAFLLLNELGTCRRTYEAILQIFLKHEGKIDYALSKPRLHRHEYIHPRYHPVTFDEFWDEWGNKQNDAIGAILFGLAGLETRGVHLIDAPEKVRIVQKLVDYLGHLKYWEDPDSGVWEENEELHASSVGACVAGLRDIRAVRTIAVPPDLVVRGMAALDRLLPRESEKKFADLAQLSLIWPFKVVTHAQADEILKNITYHLERHRGVIRYKNDHYYNKNPDGHSEEAEWCFGFSWLAIIFEQMGQPDRAREYVEKARRTINAQGEVPELYFSNSAEAGPNSPLGWAESLFIIALYNINEKHRRQG